MDIENLAAATVEDFGDRRVIFHLDDSGMLDTFFGGLYYGQSPSGPTTASITRNVSDAALATFAGRHRFALDALRNFRDQSRVGASMLVSPAVALSA
ncbi:hypothetical protein [Variovorax saccharolyticus]|uniref:hypothetical protein n=1 Tax=Variovorax saccharolyticus TaxID=3053516 RepID=UPI002577995E|nr:hypothetical protein [Variovorax sp. J22R187]MDM0018389.1 hypothetical protein [Variovorax sp. J22R187]